MKTPRIMKTVAVVGTLACLGLTSCAEEIGGGDGAVAISKPEHPAMSAEIGAPPKKAAASSSALPAGHPPVADRGAGSASPGGARANSGGTPAGSGTPEGGTGGSAPGSTEGGPMNLMGLSFNVPKGWVREVPASRMRIAQFRLPKADGDADDAVITVIPSGGSIDDNVSRWEGQFNDSTGAEMVDKSPGGVTTKIVAIEGTFLFKARPMAPGPATPKTGYKLYAAIVQAPKAQLFFKGVGPKATIEKWQASFDAMVDSFQAN